MARIKDSSVDAVKSAIDMVEHVSAYTQPRKVGSRYTARCPFHEERTPSFSINAVDRLYYCFGCGAKGDAITFVREKEGLDFAQAIEWLADRFRVPLEYEEVSPEVDARRRRTERLHALLEQAAAFYERYLWESANGEPGRAYLAGRGLGEEIARAFRLGLAPSEGRTLAQKAREKGFSDEELRAAGLLNRRGYDYFQGRLTFPLADARGRILGFQARKLRDDDPLAAKYVNSPEGELFQKGAILYGLDLARAAIAKEDGAVIVEGNTDVLALRQAGLEPVVASMGTALTERQLKELARLTTHVTLCFDGDKAGQDATLRGMDLAVGQGLDVRVVALPPEVDPADAADRFVALLEQAESYPVYRVRLEIQREPDRKKAADIVGDFLGKVPNSVDRQDAAAAAEDLLRVPPGTFGPRALARTGRVSPKLLEAGDRLERDALAGVVAHADLVPLLAELTPEHFDLELHRRVREHLLSRGPTDDELIGLLAELDARADSEAIDEDTSKELLLRLRERGIRRELAGCEDPGRIKELQTALTKLREAVGALS
jgi:DNA primase catalytic core